MKFRADGPIPNPINLELKDQPRTLNPHIQRKIQVIKLHALRRREPGKEAFRHGVQIRRQRAHIDEVLLVRLRGYVGVARDEVILDDEGLAGAEVACVVEGYGG